MYKFTNGIVVFDEETRDKYIHAGMTLVKEEKNENDKVRSNPIVGVDEKTKRDVKDSKQPHWK